MKKIILAVLVLSAVLAVVNAEVLRVPSNVYSQGVVGKASGFTVNLTVNSAVKHIPVDVVLAIDCSPSMGRYSKVIYGPVTVNITNVIHRYGRWVPIAKFTLDKTSNVEILLSYPLEDYYNDSGMGYDRIDVALDNATPSQYWGYMCMGWSTCGDPASFIFENVPKGSHTVYAKLYGMPRTEIRTLIIALPPTRIDAAKDTAKYFVGLLKDDDRAAVVRVGSVDTTEIKLNLTDDKVALNNTIDSLTLDDWVCMGCCCRRFTRVYELTALGEGLKKACDILNASSRQSVKAIILLTDGGWNDGISPIDVARYIAKPLGYRIYTIGFGAVNESLLKQIAEITGGKYYYAASEEDLKEIYDEIYKEITVYATNVTLTLNFDNPNVKFDHAIPSPTSVSGNVVSWHWNELKNNTSVTVWVNSTVAGKQTVAVGNLTYYDYSGLHSVQFNVTMNFSGNLVVTATPNKTAIWEGETVGINITSTHPISRITYNATPPITNANSIVTLTVNNNTARMVWTPLLNYTNKNTTATINITVYSPPYGINSTSVSVQVFNKKAPLIVKVIPSRNSITEGETVTIKLIANYPIDSSNVIVSGFPVEINSTNSNIVKYNLNNTTVIVSWTPLQNFVSGGQTYVNEKLTFDMTSNNGLSGSASAVISVYNRTVNKPGEVLVSRVRNLYIITYLDKTPPKDVGFKVEVDGKVIDYTNDSFILTYFRKNDTAWILDISPQYTFTNNLTQNVTANVTFYTEKGVYLNGTSIKINKTNVTFYPVILNVRKLDNLTINWNGSIGYPIPLYVGEVININGKLINATDGNVTVNGLVITNTSSGIISAVFIPNAAGDYTIKVNAINNTTTTLLLWKDVPVRIRPVTPS